LDDPEDGTLFTPFVKILGWVGLEIGMPGRSELKHFCCSKCREAFVLVLRKQGRVDHVVCDAYTGDAVDLEGHEPVPKRRRK
jgi:hypothetical protein